MYTIRAEQPAITDNMGLDWGTYAVWQLAARCYVYLSDVSSSVFDTNGESNLRPWESDFRKKQMVKGGRVRSNGSGRGLTSL
jgi:hypothetical protein